MNSDDETKEKIKKNGFKMKLIKTTSLPMMALLLSGLIGCTAKESGKVVNNTYVTNPSTVTPTTPDPTDPVTGCNGIPRSGATSCYYTNLPQLVFSGPGTIGPVYWSSNTNLPSHISPNQFRTDATFSVRIKPSYADGGNSTQGRSCSQFTKTNFGKLQVQVMLRRSNDSLGEVKTLTADVGAYSSTARFSVPGGTTNPYILEVVSVLSNHRCNAYYGSAVGGCPNVYYDIPVNSSPNPTECVAFHIEYATDNTYDLPN